MANTYTLISSVTVGAGGAAEIVLSSIPSTYTDLQLVFSVRSSYAANRMNFNGQFNASTSGYSYKNLSGDGGTASSGNNIIGTSAFYIGEMTAASSTANTFTNGALYIPNYTSSNYKSASVDEVNEANTTTSVAYAVLDAVLWSNTAAITSIRLTPGAGNFDQYSTAYLYGIKNS